MKALFKLKNKPIEDVIYMTEKEAQATYHDTHFGGTKMSRFVPNGFYTKRLTFEQFLSFYKIKIL